jgi:transcriptional regulator with XRE-family HTH domain
MNLSHLKKLLASHGVSQTDLARILGRDKSVITNLFQGKRQLKADEAMLIARQIGVPVTQILGIPEHRDGFMEPPLLIPFQHEPTHWKRHGNVVRKEGKFYLEASESGDYSPKAYAMEVSDDSLNLSGVLAGDFVISELDRRCKPGQLVIAQHYQGRGAKTLIRKYDPPLLLPHSTNAAFKPLNADKDEVRLVSPVLKLIRAY